MGSNQHVEGDICSHTFDVMSTAAVNAMETATGDPALSTPAGITASCGACHTSVLN